VEAHALYSTDKKPGTDQTSHPVAPPDGCCGEGV
jgi:hypothetical protein